MIRKSVMCLVIILSASFIASTLAADDMPVLPEYRYAPSNTVLDDVNEKRNAAISKNKRLMVVFGAEWCHDSRGLSQRFSRPKINAILQKKYEIVFVDIGYLTTGFKAIQQLNQPIYYGTPAVLIVDPKTNTLLNESTIMHWTNADSLALAEYNDYFSQDFELPLEEETRDPVVLAYLAEIRQFEKTQAARLRLAYQVVGPLLKSYKETDIGLTDEFENTWDEVKSYRTAIPGDVAKLVEQAKTKAENGDKTALDFPEYPAFSWEK
ncbi:MAG: hypothetical protein ACI808_000294 [Paraglaciecola sp.]|jgi:hypothetical protein